MRFHSPVRHSTISVLMTCGHLPLSKLLLLSPLVIPRLRVVLRKHTKTWDHLQVFLWKSFGRCGKFARGAITSLSGPKWSRMHVTWRRLISGNIYQRKYLCLLLHSQKQQPLVAVYLNMPIIMMFKFSLKYIAWIRSRWLKYIDKMKEVKNEDARQENKVSA